MELSGDTLSISRELSALDESVLEFTRILDDVGVKYVIVSGYVTILTGRSRSTEDVDIIIERLTEDETEHLVSALKSSGYWGMAMPLHSMHELLAEGDRIRIAEADEVFPNFEVWFVSNQTEREALEESITCCLDSGEIEISPIELQIAYKLRLAHRAGSATGKDFEDALHLYLTFEGQFNRQALEEYVQELGVEGYYDELRRA